MTITVVPNTPPTFVSDPVAQTVFPGQVKTYILPSTIDVDGDVVTVALLSGAPTYVTFTAASNTLTISPPVRLLATSFTVSMRVSDGFGVNDYTIQISIVNTPPTFPSTLTDQFINVGSSANYTLPSPFDAENQVVTIIAYYQGTTVLPGFVSFNPSTRILTMQPIRGIDSGSYLIDLTLFDGSLSTLY